jgi:hypothetical protein
LRAAAGLRVETGMLSAHQHLEAAGASLSPSQRATNPPAHHLTIDTLYQAFNNINMLLQAFDDVDVLHRVSGYIRKAEKKKKQLLPMTTNRRPMVHLFRIYTQREDTSAPKHVKQR